MEKIPSEREREGVDIYLSIYIRTVDLRDKK